MSIQPEDVDRIGELARLEIPADARERMAAELSSILEFVATLDQLDLTGCEPRAFAPVDAPLREDLVNGRRLDTDAALAAAPAQDGAFFLTPPIVENLNP